MNDPYAWAGLMIVGFFVAIVIGAVLLSTVVGALLGSALAGLAPVLR